jgi:hypothetical protein
MDYVSKDRKPVLITQKGVGVALVVNIENIRPRKKDAPLEAWRWEKGRSAREGLILESVWKT